MDLIKATTGYGYPLLINLDHVKYIQQGPLIDVEDDDGTRAVKTTSVVLVDGEEIHVRQSMEYFHLASENPQ